MALDGQNAASLLSLAIYLDGSRSNVSGHAGRARWGVRVRVRASPLHGASGQVGNGGPQLCGGQTSFKKVCRVEVTDESPLDAPLPLPPLASQPRRRIGHSGPAEAWCFGDIPASITQGSRRGCRPMRSGIVCACLPDLLNDPTRGRHRRPLTTSPAH